MKKSKQGRAPNDEKANREEESKMEASHESFTRELTKILHMAASTPQRSDGSVSYKTRYRQSSTGYQGRLFADGVAMANAPRRVRAIAYRDIGVCDWDVSMAYFTFAAQAIDKLAIEQDGPYFRLETVKKYISDRDCVRKSISETRAATESVCKTMRRKVFNG